MASHPEFDDKTTATEVAAALGDCIRGKNVVVTGISPASLGCSTAMAIASQSPETLVLASRTQAKLDAVAADIAAAHPGVRVVVVRLDLGSVASVQAAAAAVASAIDRVDVLINNAGVSAPKQRPMTAPDGTLVDAQFFVNHLGVFLLTSLLLPLLRAAALETKGRPRGATRVVNLSSHGHRLSPVRFSDYAFARAPLDVPAAEQPPASAMTASFSSDDTDTSFFGYGQSKTANILHASELARRLRRAGHDVAAFSVHPGTIETELSRHLDAGQRAAIARTAPLGLWKTQDQGAATTLVAAFDPALGAADDVAVGYLSDCQLRDALVAAHAADPAAADRLWTESERLLQHG